VPLDVQSLLVEPNNFFYSRHLKNMERSTYLKSKFRCYIIKNFCQCLELFAVPC